MTGVASAGTYVELDPGVTAARISGKQFSPSRMLARQTHFAANSSAAAGPSVVLISLKTGGRTRESSCRSSENAAVLFGLNATPGPRCLKSVASGEHCRLVLFRCLRMRPTALSSIC